MRKWGYCVGAVALAVWTDARAQDAGNVDNEDDVTKLERIVVTANRTPTEKSQVGSTVEQVTSEEIEEKSLPSIGDYLNLLPGIAISSGGGIGSEAGLAVRGMPRRYVKTLYNGIDIADPTQTQVQTSYQYLLTGGADSIEVLKGSQSTLYGSDAIAGVISVSTLGSIDPGVRHFLDTEAGSFGMARGRYGLQAASEASALALNVTGLRTDGISAADENDGNTERDGFEDVLLDVNVEHRFSDAFSVFGSALYIDARAEYDDDFPVVQDNWFNHNLTEQLAGRTGFNLDLMDGRLKNTFSVQGFKIDRGIRSVSTFGPYDADFEGTRVKTDYQGSFEATERILFQYGLDHERQNARTSDDFAETDDSFSITGVWAQSVVEPVDNLILTGGLRHDEHSEFGGHTTYRGTAAYLFDATATRLHSSFGTGFRAPSLYELYAPFYGDSSLRPETSVSFDFGVGQEFLDGRLVTDLTYFMIDVDDLIEFDTAASRYRQVPGTTRSRGVEASLDFAVTDGLRLGGSYTYTDSKTEGGERMVQIPRHAIVLSAAWLPDEQWTVSGDVKFAVDTVDTGDVELDDYVLVNAKVAYRYNENVEVYVRGENLLDQQYQTVAGYGTPGLSVFTGIEARF